MHFEYDTTQFDKTSTVAGILPDAAPKRCAFVNVLLLFTHHMVHESSLLISARLPVNCVLTTSVH
jgi:hypothetical protein